MEIIHNQVFQSNMIDRRPRGKHLFRKHRDRGRDQTDASFVQLPRLSDNSSEEEAGGELTLNPLTGEWTHHVALSNGVGDKSFSRLIKERLSRVKAEKPSFSLRQNGQETVSLINDDDSTELEDL